MQFNIESGLVCETTGVYKLDLCGDLYEFRILFAADAIAKQLDDGADPIVFHTVHGCKLELHRQTKSLVIQMPCCYQKVLLCGKTYREVLAGLQSAVNDQGYMIVL